MKLFATSIIAKFFPRSRKEKRRAATNISQRCGAILIEFAFSIPVLIGILFTVVDAPKFYYLKYKVKNAAYVASSLIQSGVKKAITGKDLSRIFSAAFFNHFPGTSQYFIDSKWPIGYTKIAHVYYVIGTTDNKAMVKWAWKSNSNAQNINDEGALFTQSQATSAVKFQLIDIDSDPESICKHLSIEEGEARIIIDVGFLFDEITDAKKCMGFTMLPLRPSCGTSYFNTVLIFTPKAGLFSEIPPACLLIGSDPSE